MQISPSGLHAKIARRPERKNCIQVSQRAEFARRESANSARLLSAKFARDSYHYSYLLLLTTYRKVQYSPPLLVECVAGLPQQSCNTLKVDYIRLRFRNQSKTARANIVNPPDTAKPTGSTTAWALHCCIWTLVGLISLPIVQSDKRWLFWRAMALGMAAGPVTMA
jgi:hypothetical protein